MFTPGRPKKSSLTAVSATSEQRLDGLARRRSQAWKIADFDGPVAVQATKEFARMAASGPANTVRKVQAERRTTIFGSEDATEGPLALVEKREPVGRGR